MTIANLISTAPEPDQAIASLLRKREHLRDQLARTDGALEALGASVSRQLPRERVYASRKPLARQTGQPPRPATAQAAGAPTVRELLEQALKASQGPLTPAELRTQLLQAGKAVEYPTVYNTLCARKKVFKRLKDGRWQLHPQAA